MGRRHLIVGSGIGGLAAAEAIRAREADAEIALVSEEPHDYYSRPGLAYLLRGDIPESRLPVRTPDDVKRLRLERVHDRVDRIEPGAHEIVLAGRRRIKYERLLLATGALASPPPFPGKELSGVLKLDSLDDARKIVKAAKRGRPAIVVGGGITALELAEGLAARGMKVDYLLRGDRYWADVLDETESQIIQRRLERDGIKIRTETQVGEAVGAGDKLTNVVTQTGERVPCELLAVAIGVKPRIDLAKAAGLDVDRGVLVDEYLRTSATDIYAAGDCAQVFDPTSGKATLDVLWSTALAQGRVAGINMAGGGMAYRKGVACNITLLAGLRTSILGDVGAMLKPPKKERDLVSINRGDSESWRVQADAGIVERRNDDNRIRLIVGEKRLLGALVLGDQHWSRPLQRMIVAQADITSIRKTLLAGGEAAMEKLAVFYSRWEEGNQRRR